MFRRTRALSCRKVGKLLQTYLDGELDGTRGVLVAEHLDTCVRCGLDARTYRWLTAHLSGLAPPDGERQLDRLRAFADDLVQRPV